MKKQLFISFIIAASMMTSCIATRSTAKINKVEIGMTKNDISQLLGTPIIKNGDIMGEQWGYRKMIGEIAGPEEVLFLVTFDNQGKVVDYETIKEHPHFHH